MKGYDDKPAARLQKSLGRRQPRGDFVQLSVYGNSQGLERAGGRMTAFDLPGAEHLTNDFRQLESACDPLLFPGTDNGAGDGPGFPLLPKMEEDVRQLFLAERVHQIGGRRTLERHAHVERAVILKGEAALGLVELHR